MSRVVLAMSGGVDSSVAAWLLREQGHDVVGLFMRHGQEQPSASCGAAVSAASAGGTPAPQTSCGKQGCCTAADAADARRVADMLDIPFYAVNFEQEFARIVDYFVAEYTAGRTPNPCIVCNTWLKFGRLFDYADNIGADFVATGHYARLVRLAPGSEQATRSASGGADIPVCRDGCENQGRQECLPHPPSMPDGGIALFRGLDESKDQSYVLFGIQRQLLPRLMFPLGEHRKQEIRRIAQRLGLRVAAKRDSQEICFVPDQDHARFVRQHRGSIDTSGEIVTTDGTVVGRHDGFERFTVGQRKGLRVALGEPRYVVRIEPATRRVVLGTREELARCDLYAAEANWLVGERGQGSAVRGQRAGLGTSVPSEVGSRQWAVGSGKWAVGSRQWAVGSESEIGNRKSKIPNPKSENRTDRQSPSSLPSPLSSLPSFRAQVKIRYRSRPAAATVELLPGGRFHVRFDEPCHAVAPGQAAVCYDGDRVLGGGWIE
jgi:tRNA-specific 2-thiouridylase